MVLEKWPWHLAVSVGKPVMRKDALGKVHWLIEFIDTGGKFNATSQDMTQEHHARNGVCEPMH